MSFGSQNNCPQASQRCCDTPPFLGRTFQGSIFFSAIGVEVVVKGLLVENKSSWVHHWSKMFFFIRRRVRCFPPLNCAEVHWGRRHQWRLRRLQGLWAVVLIFSTFYSVFLPPLLPEYWMGLAAGSDRSSFVGAKSIWHCWFVRIRVDCNDLRSRRYNGWYWYQFPGFVAWHLCGVEDNWRV